MAISNEIGRQGQKRNGGIIQEEFLRELQGRKGAAAYKEMSENDDVIGAVLFAIEMLIRQAEWDVRPAGESDIDNEASDFIWSCMNDMQETWTDTISEILSFLIYGWSAHEIVYKRRAGANKDIRLRSKYNDGLIGWQKLPIRGQESLYEWKFDEHDNLLAMVQLVSPGYTLIEIPANKLLLFKTKSRKGNPEGRSILRNAYRSWYFKRRIQEIEGIGIERDLAGFPVLTAPENLDIWDEDDPNMVKMRVSADAIVQNIRRDSLEGVSLPNGWELSLLSSGGQRQFDTNAVINRYDTRIAMTVLADFILLGHQGVGSMALSVDKTELFGLAISSFLGIICEIFNSVAIPSLINMNGEHFRNITDYPQLTFGDIDAPDLAKIGAFIRDTTASGALIPDDSIEDYLRNISGLPERSVNEGTKLNRNNELADDIPPEEVMESKKRLGRVDV